MAIELQPVASSQIAAIGYDAGSKTLAVQFNPRKSTPDTPGEIYHYSGVEPESHQDLVNAESIGKHFNQYVKSSFPYERIDQTKADGAPQEA